MVADDNLVSIQSQKAEVSYETNHCPTLRYNKRSDLFIWPSNTAESSIGLHRPNRALVRDFTTLTHPVAVQHRDSSQQPVYREAGALTTVPPCHHCTTITVPPPLYHPATIKANVLAYSTILFLHLPLYIVSIFHRLLSNSNEWVPDTSALIFGLSFW